MTVFTDRLIGVYHFLGDRIPRDIPEVEPKPRSNSPWRMSDSVTVVKIGLSNGLRPALERAISSLGSLEDIIKSGDRVMVKPNFNSPDPFPASTDLTFLKEVVGLILETGARVTIGDSAGGVWRPTRKVFDKLGLPELARKMGVELIAFEDRPQDWVRIKISGDYLESVVMPRSAYEADRIVYLPCIKTHRLAWFSGSMKLAFGFVAPGQRRSFHTGNLQQKLAEVNLCWQPDIIIMDGRKAFISGGPDRGQVVEPGVIMASGDLVATDVEAMKIILSYHAENKLPTDPWELPQIVTARKHGLGVEKDKYTVIN